ncbi:STAS domain-containing protein [Rossellomorea vietnamensis]|uniref:Anti-sigma factor antagonist n=1 Tax=Rossellomorea vietnamensis TaxID=218284 RepID=A0A5D4MD09_9BACI|nr:STAS domain-containing protein [Rossellomorea vietnamensis]TYR98850.1 STAS domain-containing protein [Rossellomorea vietnamensis]
MEKLKIYKETTDLAMILKLVGVLDISTASLVDHYIEENEEIGILVMDFSGITFIDSTGIGAVTNAIHYSQEKGFTLRLQGVNDMTNDVFEMVGLYKIMNAVHGEVI